MADRWEDYFDPDEKLLWQGQPRPKTGLSFVIVFLALFGLPFLIAGLGVFGSGIAGIFNSGAGLGGVGVGMFMLFFSVPFIGAGAAMVFGPWYMQANAHRKVRYALSNRRAYIATQWWTRKLQTVRIAADATVTLENGKDVYFRTEVSKDSDGDRTTERKGFESIADAEEVYRLIRGIQDEAAKDRDDD
jgi:hypothetical protein